MNQNTKITNKDKKRIFKRAYWMINGGSFDSETLTFSEALKRCWKELKEYKNKLKAEIEQELKSQVLKLRWAYDVEPTENYKQQLAFNNGTKIF